MTTIGSADYTATVALPGAPEAVFDAITTVVGLNAWWNPVSGALDEGGELRFDMGRAEGPLIIRVHSARRATLVVWDVLSCPFLADWDDTTIVFDLGREDDGQCALFFRHHGLTPGLDCYDVCRPSWNHYLRSSLRDYVATGAGSPVGSDADNARRRNHAEASPRDLALA